MYYLLYVYGIEIHLDKVKSNKVTSEVKYLYLIIQ